MTEYKNRHLINNKYVDLARADLFQKTAKQPFFTAKKKKIASWLNLIPILTNPYLSQNSERIMEVNVN